MTACFLGVGLAAITLLASSPLLHGQDQSSPQNSKPQATQTPAQQPSQQPPQQSKISVVTRMVTVYASVSDKKGSVVSTLTRDDFLVTQEGQPQEITYFATQKDLPLTIGLLVDTSRSQQSVLGQERTASYSFLDHMLRDEKDRAFLIHFDHEVELLQDLTSSRQKLQSALDQMNTPELERTSDDDGQGRHSSGGGTLLYDAVYLASTELMQKEQGRKALIILSDGVDRGSKESLSDAIEAAQRANTVVYSILFKGESPRGEYGNHGGWGGGGGGGGGPYGHGGGHRFPQEERPDGKKILERIAKETGGRLFEASKKETADDIYTQIAAQLRGQYILGYTPTKDESGPGYHKIQVTTKQKDLTVQARDGYYGQE